jgi:pectate lyase
MKRGKLLGSVITLAAVCVLSFGTQPLQGQERHQAATYSTVFNDLRGFGAATTGGLGGQVYVVKRRDDPVLPVPGTLRYGVEHAPLPVWIVFDPGVFPAGVKRTIYLRSALLPRSNTTIDGRGSYVSLRRAYRLEHVDWDEVNDGVWQCRYEAAHRGKGGPILALDGAANVIVTHLEFAQEYRGVHDAKDADVPHISNYTQLDTECFGDVINIVNDDETTQNFNNIWINHSNFTGCGDECIGITHPNTTRRAYLTISNNLFTWSYKAILLGGLTSDTPFMIAASLYGNRFVGVKRRQPQVGKAYAHVFNNIYEDWKGGAVSATPFSRVIVEHNVFRPITQVTNSWSVSGTDAYLWARNNKYSVGDFNTPTFPACGFAWYYRCDVPRIDISSMTYSTARDVLRALGGWKNVPNDVR